MPRLACSPADFSVVSASSYTPTGVGEGFPVHVLTHTGSLPVFSMTPRADPSKWPPGIFCVSHTPSIPGPPSVLQCRSRGEGDCAGLGSRWPGRPGRLSRCPSSAVLRLSGHRALSAGAGGVNCGQRGRGVVPPVAACMPFSATLSKLLHETLFLVASF